MIKTALRWGILCVFCLFLATSFFRPRRAWASNSQYQQCLTTTNCTVGEFLYDDNYTPISVGATCSLTSRYPNGDVFINAGAMSGTADGWYSYDVGTSGLATGLYRGQMCCTVSGDYLCLDKTFEVSSGLNSSIVADIWAYPSRSLSSFSNLISGIWTNSNRTLSSATVGDGTTLATTANLTTLSSQVSTVQTTVESIDTKVSAMQTQIGSISTNTTNILAKWGSYSVADVIGYVDTVETQLGNNGQTCSDNSVFGHIHCVQDKWGSETAETLYTAANGAYTTISALRSEMAFNGKSTTAYDEIQTIKGYVDTIESSIGSTSDTSAAESIFGRIKQVKEAIAEIDNTSLDLSDLMDKWGSYSATDIYDKVKSLSSEVSAINTVSNVSSILNVSNTSVTNITEIKNQVVAMKALLDVNRIQLEKINNQPIVKNWLEEGSIIFKTLATNPSSLTKQTVNYRYNLPPEVKGAMVIKKSPGIEIKYDANQGFYYGSGEFELQPKETLILEIEVEDIWQISEEKIESLKAQATQLFEPLKKTSFFAQGATLHSDIIASLEKIAENQKGAKMPEDRIKIFKENSIELESVNRKIESLKTLTTQSGSIGTLSGFIGGVQTFAVWGIVIVLVAGFVFLALYIKSLTPRTEVKIPEKIQRQKSHFYYYVLFFGIGISLGTGSFVLGRSWSKPKEEKPKTAMVLSATTEVTPTPTPIPVEKEEPPVVEEEIRPTPTPTLAPVPTKSLTKKVVVAPSINSYANVRLEPERTAILVGKVVSGQELEVTGEKFNDLGEKWIKIKNEEISGWILGELVLEVQGSATAITANPRVKIVVPDRDQVYLYSRPSFNAGIAYKITETQAADILVETKRWVKIILVKINKEGWISQDFIEKVLP